MVDLLVSQMAVQSVDWTVVMRAWTWGHMLGLTPAELSVEPLVDWMACQKVEHWVDRLAWPTAGKMVALLGHCWAAKMVIP